MSDDPKQKPVALVTGASRGIGRAVAMALAATGRHVLINCHTRVDAAGEVLRTIQAAGGSGEVVPFDVSDCAAAARAIEGVLARHGRVDVLVNNAGVRDDMLMVWMGPPNWQKVLDTNLTGFFAVTQPLLKTMMVQRSGRIVNIASTAGQSGMPGQVNYSAAKAGLIGATKALAREVAKRGITVNAVAPGFIDTEMLQGLPVAEMVKAVPLGRLGRPEEVAAVVVYLCSADAGYITGQVIAVNGGVY